MLQRLYISHYAIIEELTWEPDEQFNVITGETGAGKSILVGALSLIMGARADSAAIQINASKCIVEATFSIPDQDESLRNLFSLHDLDVEDTCIIRRELTNKGKSRAFVNDTPVTLTLLQELTALLVDLHQQFDNLQLSQSRFQIEALDAVALATTVRQNYTAHYKQWEKLTTAITEAEEQLAQQQKENDYREYLLKELQEFHPQDNELEYLENQMRQLQNQEKLQENLGGSLDLLQENDHAILVQLKKAIQHLQAIQNVLPSMEASTQRMSTCYEDLKDIAGTLNGSLIALNNGGQDAEALAKRYDEGQRLLKKHSVKTTEELIAVWKTLQEVLTGHEEGTQRLKNMQKEAAILHALLLKDGASLHRLRAKAIDRFSQNTNSLLHLMGMPTANFRISLQPLPNPTAHGTDHIVFELDANKSGHFTPLHKTASGGELSRIMLAIKTQIAGSMYLPTLIFDEVDTGIGGEAAKQVGKLLQELGRRHQVICITHQPQIAAIANNHYFVYKGMDKQGKIATHLSLLHKEKRVEHIAEMITGKEPTEAALQHARELMER